MFVASHPLPGPRAGVLTAFDPGTRTLEAGFQVAPPFKPLPVDIVFDKDVAMRLRDGVTIHVDVFRPLGTEPRSGDRGVEPLRQGTRHVGQRDGRLRARRHGQRDRVGVTPRNNCHERYLTTVATAGSADMNEHCSGLVDRYSGRDAKGVPSRMIL
jgi:hypothetical protein